MAEKLRDKIISLLNKMQGTRKNLVKDKFNRIAVIPPSKICIENYIRTKPHAAFNPGAILVNDEIHMFPRLIFDYYKYTSCIGHLTMKMSDLYELNQREKVSTKIIMTPTYLWEFKGCEDPRIFKHNEKYIFFYTGYGYEWVDNKLETRIRQGVAWLDSNFNVEKRACLRFKDDHKYYYYPTKDSTIISMSNNKTKILTRPSIMDLEVGWKTVIDLNDPVVNINELEPV
ncbi:MAG TPA: hypothetical protein ENF87_01190, partial [Thermoproteales archaeon]|nr:hypothetical protein [Thermoproteales archaeon]